VIVKTAAAALIAVALSIGCGGTHEGGSVPAGGPPPVGNGAVGAVAPSFTGRDVDGNPFNLSKHLGRDVILLDFCATWCEPCVAEFPHLRRLYEKNRRRGFIVVAIAIDGADTIANVPGFVRRNQIEFPVVPDPDARIASMYNPRRAVPLSVLIDRAGRVIEVREGFTPGDEDSLAKQVESALEPLAAAR
jgi:peroxiredoxin